MAVRAADSAMPDDLDVGGAGRNTLGQLVAVVRRLWWVVLAVLWLCLVAAAASAASTPTTYVGRSSLIVASNDRSPDQDAVLVQGYVAYFDDAAYQRQLLDQAGIHSSSTIAAQAAASSPILVVTATALDPVAAQANAVAVATAFSEDINETHSRATSAALATLQDQLDTALSRNSRQDQAVIASLQDRIRQLQSDQVNVLQVLQLQGGVSSDGPPWTTNLALGAAAGLILGVLAALALNGLSRRVRSRHDLAGKVGLVTLAELPETVGDTRAERVRQLANLLRARLDGSGVVAVAEALDGSAAPTLARELATEWAGQGFETVLVRLGTAEASEDDQGKGQPVGRLDGSGASGWLAQGSVNGLSVLEARPGSAHATRGFPAAAVTRLLQLDELAGRMVVVEAADVVRSAAAQVAGGAADLAVLVVDPTSARVPETREASAVLRDSGAVLLGAVLAPAMSAERHDRPSWPDSPEAEAEAETGEEDAWSWRAANGSQKPLIESQVPHRNGFDVGVARRKLVSSVDETGSER